MHSSERRNGAGPRGLRRIRHLRVRHDRLRVVTTNAELSVAASRARRRNDLSRAEFIRIRQCVAILSVGDLTSVPLGWILVVVDSELRLLTI